MKLSKIIPFAAVGILGASFLGEQCRETGRGLPEFGTVASSFVAPPSPNLAPYVNWQQSPIIGNLPSAFTNRVNRGLDEIRTDRGTTSFVVETEDMQGDPVAFIRAPSQEYASFDEGVGYAGEALVLDRQNYADKIIARQNQDLFNAVTRGIYKFARNDNGLFGWRFYYYDVPQEDMRADTSVSRCVIKTYTNKNGIVYEQGIRFIRVTDTYEATDAPLKIAENLISAIDNVQRGVWTMPPADIDYEMILSELIPRIRDQLALEINGRYVLTVSDDVWADKDQKGTVIFNPSYAVLSALYKIALYLHNSGFIDEAEFFLKLHQDSFDALAAIFDWSSAVFDRLQAITPNASNPDITKVEGRDVQFLVNFLERIKVIPQRTQLFSSNGVVVIDNSYMFSEDACYMADDGSWDINTKALNFVLGFAQREGIDLFFPDWVELEVVDSVFVPRISVGRSPGEGMDGIRVGAEIARDLYTTKAHPELFSLAGFARYQIAPAELELLGRILPYRGDPSSVMASRYHNSVALFNYLIAHAAYGVHTHFSGFLQAAQSYSNWADPQDNISQYYNFFTSIRNGAFLGYYMQPARPLIAKATDVASLNSALSATFSRTERVLYPIHQPLFGSPNTDYFLGVGTRTVDALLPDSLSSLIGNEARALREKDPFYKKAAQRRYENYKTAVGISDLQDREELRRVISSVARVRPVEVFYFADSLLGIGYYHEAADVFFYLAVYMGDPQNEDQEIVLQSSLEQIISINRILNLSHEVIGDKFEWLANHPEHCPGKKGFYVRAYYLRQLNQVQRVSEAQQLGLQLLREYDKAYSRADAFYSLQERAEHARHVGANLRNPNPREALFTRIACSVIASVSRDYEPTRHPVYRVSQRDYYYDYADDLARILLEESVTFDSSTTPSAIYETAQLFDKWRNSVPKDLHPRVLIARAEIYGTRAYDLREREIALRHFSADAYKDLTGDVIGWNARIENLNSAMEQLIKKREFLEKALQAELDGARDVKVLNEILKNLIGVYLFYADLLYDRNQLVLWMVSIPSSEESAWTDPNYTSDPARALQLIRFYKNPASGYTDSSGTLDMLSGQLADVFNSAILIAAQVNTPFSNPIGNHFTPTALMPQDPIPFAAALVVKALPSTDPRNAQYFDWLKIMLDIDKMRLRMFPTDDALRLAFSHCGQMGLLYVSNENLRAQYAYESVLQTGQVLYEYLKEKSQNAQDVFGYLEGFLLRQRPLTIKARNALIELGAFDIYNDLNSQYSTYPNEIRIIVDAVSQGVPLTAAQRRAVLQVGLEDVYNKLCEILKSEERQAIDILFGMALENRVPDPAERKIITDIGLEPILDGIGQNRESLARMFHIEPSLKARAYAQKGNLELWGEISEKKTREAIADYERAVSIDSYSVDALVGLAQAHQRLADMARGQGKNSEYLSETTLSFRYCIRAIFAISSGFEASREAQRDVAKALLAVLSSNTQFPGKAEMENIFLGRRVDELRAWEMQRIIQIATIHNLVVR